VAESPKERKEQGGGRSSISDLSQWKRVGVKAADGGARSGRPTSGCGENASVKGGGAERPLKRLLVVTRKKLPER